MMPRSRGHNPHPNPETSIQDASDMDLIRELHARRVDIGKLTMVMKNLDVISRAGTGKRLPEGQKGVNPG